MKTLKEAVIFDMDGVLIDSQPMYYEFDISLLGRFGHSTTVETVIPYSGLTSVDRMTRYKNDFGLRESVPELIKISVDTMREVFSSRELKPIEGIPELLSFVKQRGVRLGVASSTSHELIELILQKLGFFSMFDKIVSGEDVAFGKPAPDVYLKSAEIFGLSPAVCVAVEDSAAGIASASSAGFTCIAYRNGYTTDYSLADYVVDNFYDSIPIISKLCLPWVDVEYPMPRFGSRYG